MALPTNSNVLTIDEDLQSQTNSNINESPRSGKGGGDHVARYQALGAAALIFASSAFTTSVSYSDPSTEFHLSGASSVLSPGRTEQRGKITIRQARRLAIRILEDAKQSLREERQREASLLIAQLEE